MLRPPITNYWAKYLTVADQCIIHPHLLLPENQDHKALLRPYKRVTTSWAQNPTKEIAEVGIDPYLSFGHETVYKK
jgi:hypothetical protein